MPNTMFEHLTRSREFYITLNAFEMIEGTSKILRAV